MIIYGSRVYGKQDLISAFGTCEQCGKYGPHRSYNGRMWGHIYWIPLIPVGKKIRVVKECKACKRGLHLPHAQLEVSRSELREGTDRALAALLAGKTEVDVGGVQADCVNEIGGSLDLLLALGEAHYVELLLAALRQKSNCDYPRHICEGLMAEWEGRQEDAIQSYRQALRLADRSTLPAASLSRIYMHRKDYDAAEAVLEQILAVTPEASHLHGQLALIRTLKGDADGAATSYETLFRLAPGVAQDKGLYKDYRKVCKKAGRKPLPASNFP